MSGDIEIADDNKQISISRLTYRGMQIIIAVGLSGVMGLSSWILVTVYSISGRVTSIEAKMEMGAIVSAQSENDTYRNVKAEIDQVQDRLVKLEDKLNMALGIKPRR